MTGFVYAQSVISNGYGDLRGKTFRIAHMGDVTDGEMREVLDVMSEFLAGARGML